MGQRLHSFVLNAPSAAANRKVYPIIRFALRRCASFSDNFRRLRTLGSRSDFSLARDAGDARVSKGGGQWGVLNAGSMHAWKNES